jgi:hypothetical protein
MRSGRSGDLLSLIAFSPSLYQAGGPWNQRELQMLGPSDVPPPPGVALLLIDSAQKGTFLNPIPSSPHGLLLCATVRACYCACLLGLLVGVLCLLG